MRNLSAELSHTKNRSNYLALRTVCNRVTFQSASSPYIKITMDTNLMIQRDQVFDGCRWFKSRDDDDEDQNNLDVHQDRMVRFPFDVVKVSFGDIEDDLPYWWHELIRSKLVKITTTM